MRRLRMRSCNTILLLLFDLAALVIRPVYPFSCEGHSSYYDHSQLQLTIWSTPAHSIGKQSKLFECTYGTMVSHCWLCLCTLIPFVLLAISIHVTLAKTISTLKLHYQLLLVGDRAGRNGSSLEVDLIGLFRPIDLKKVTTVLVKVKRSTTNMKGGVWRCLEVCRRVMEKTSHIFISWQEKE